MDTSQFQFAHHKLRAYVVAARMATAVTQLLPKVPRGYGPWVDQLRRSAGSTVGLIAEGANRRSKGHKRQRFVEARGEAGETAAWIEELERCGFIGEQEALEVLQLADEVCAMLTGLIKRHS